MLDGCERADSLVVNPHKWLFTPVDCSALFCRRPDVLKRAFTLVPEYLRTPEASAVDEPHGLRGLQLGRRFRALKLWMVIRAFGRSRASRRASASTCALARPSPAGSTRDPGFERVAPVPFSTVCFRLRPRGGRPTTAAGPLNERLLEAVNASGEAFLSHTVLRGRYALRLAIGNIRTEERHVRRAWEILRGEALRLAALPTVVAGG